MKPARLFVIHIFLLAFASTTSAGDRQDPAEGTAAVTPEFNQVVYKGLVGTVLDAVPMNSSDRLGLQRTNAVVSNTLFGRSLAMLAGFSNPVLLLGGFAWGMWAAANIHPAESGAAAAAHPIQAYADAGTRERVLALPLQHLSLAVQAATADAPPPQFLADTNFPADSNSSDVAPARVIKVRGSSLRVRTEASPRPYFADTNWAMDAGTIDGPRPRVIKVWLAQRAPAVQQ